MEAAQAAKRPPKLLPQMPTRVPTRIVQQEIHQAGKGVRDIWREVEPVEKACLTLTRHINEQRFVILPSKASTIRAGWQERLFKIAPTRSVLDLDLL